MKKYLLLLGICLFVSKANAQLSSNPDKFLGNITTSGQIDYGKEKYYELWNQITPENEGKWGSIEGWTGWPACTNIYNYAKEHNIPMKYHALVWGAQYPDRIASLSVEDRYQAIVKWFDDVQKHYPDLPLIDVVNEAVWTNESNPHQPGNPMMREALGGKGKTGYDWLIKAFEMAHERWPNAILIYNDYNSLLWQDNQYIDLVRALRDAGAPIDAYGCQAHELKGLSLEGLRNADKKLQDALKMPMYVSEYDIQETNDDKQLTDYRNHIKYFWENDYCAGITLWGYVYGHTWNENTSGIIKEDGTDRKAMTWLREYMASDDAKNAKSPFPGMKKEASIYIKPAALKVANGDKLPILVRASLNNTEKTINKIELYANDELIATMTDAPYKTEYVPTSAGTKTLKAVVTDSDGKTFERLSRVTVLSDETPHTAFQGKMAELPGVIEAENFDQGAKDVAYHDSDSKNSGVDYRDDVTGVDFVKIGDGYGIGNTTSDEWLDYTVDVKEAGLYSIDIDVAAEKDGLIHIVENSLGNMNFISDYIRIPATGGAENFQTVHIRMERPLEAGQQIFTLFIDKGNMSIDKMSFNPLNVDETIEVTVTADQKTIDIGDNTEITVEASSVSSTIDYVKVYANGMLIKTMTEAPYTFTYEPVVKGAQTITAIATDVDGKESLVASYSLKVNGKRVPYNNNVVNIPGIIEAENFDQGGENLSFHDSDDIDEGDANYRTDGEGVDMVKGNGGTAIGYTATNEWLEYSVNVTEPGEYVCVATVSSGTTGSGFRVGYVNPNGSVTNLCQINVPQTGNNNWNKYETVTKTINKPFEAGEKIIRITITGNSCNIDKIELKPVSTGIDNVAASEKTGKTYNLKGQQTNANHKGIVIKNGKKFINK
ncbi:MAG: endo-1,4-beta-xylanase [Prevotella sp.]|nr:endo-1,4-beta-xylanase [Prevotella sp.]